MHPKRKTIYSQLQPNISLQESPILSSSHCDSDRSPQPFFYPTSHQPKMPKHLNLKVSVTNLLVQLKDWLIELALSQTCVSEVCEQLDPIIDQLIEAGSQNDSSYWIQTFNLNTHQISVKSGQNVCLDEDEGHGRHYSVLETEEKAEIALLGEGEKMLVQVFFRKYFRLFENCLNRIRRFSGEKKLKFLVDTTVKNIFSETLRVSYDLKLVEHRLKTQKQAKLQLCHNGHLHLLAQRILMIFKEKGNMLPAFRRLKTYFFEGCKRDSFFVKSMMKNISNLCNLYERNKRSAVTHHFYSWRQSSLQLKLTQEQSLVQLARSMARDLLPCLSPGPTLQAFKSNWRYHLQSQLNLMIDSLFGGEECLFVSMQNLMRLPRLQRNISIVQLLEEQEQICVTHRSYKEHQFLNEFSIEELKNCIITGQIYKSDRNSSSLLLVPVKPATGIVFASLAKDNQVSLSFNKTPMTMRSFRTLLRVVELVTPLLEDVAELCKKVEGEWQEIQKNGHYRMLFREFMKNDLTFGVANKGYLQITERDEDGVLIDSHRLESPTQVITSVMESLSISTLMVYHTSTSKAIRETPCVVIGESDLAKTQRHIIQSIFSELVGSGKEVMTVTRNGRTFTIIPLRRDGQVEGLIHCLLTPKGRQSNVVLDCSVVKDALVPLVMKYEGAMDCHTCHVEVNLPEIEKQKMNAVQQQRTIKNINFQQAIKVITAPNIEQLTHTLNSLLKDKGFYFSQYIFRLDLSDPSNYFYLADDQLHSLTISPSQQITHSDIFIEEISSVSSAGALSKLVYDYPCFPNPKIHKYEHQSSHNFRLIALPIKKNQQIFGYWLIGHYLSDQKIQNEKTISWIKEIGNYISLNQIFKGRRINDETLADELKVKDYDEAQQEREAFRKIRDYRGKGKLIQQFQQMLDIVGNIIPSAKSYIVKLNTLNQLVPVHSHPCKLQTLASIDLDHETAIFLTSSPLLSSHEKVLSQVCQVKKLSHNRIIRPIKHEKLHKVLIFLPQLQKDHKLKLTKKLKEKYHLEGWSSSQNFAILRQIIEELKTGDRKEENIVIMMEIGEFREGEKYFVILENSFEEEKMKNIGEKILSDIQIKLKDVLKCSLQNLPMQNQKISSITSLNSIIQNGLTKEHCVNQFKSNIQSNISKFSHFDNILSKVLLPQQFKEAPYLRLVHFSLHQMRLNSESIKHRYQVLCIMAGDIVERVQKRCQYSAGFAAIEVSIEEPCAFSQVRSCLKLIKTLSNISIKILKSHFTLLSQHSLFKVHQVKLSKMISTQKLVHSFNKLHLKGGQMNFFNQISKLANSFQTNLKLISQQFSKLSFRSRQLFLKFSNERFKTVIDHLDFGLTEKVEIMCGFSKGEQKVIFKINSEEALEEFKDKRSKEQEENSSKDGMLVIPVETVFTTKKHFLLIKISTKNGEKCSSQTALLRKVAEGGLMPCYSHYLNNIEAKTQKICDLMLRISCKQVWNGSCSEPQKIYAFSSDRCIEHQCSKLKFLNSLKSLKHSQTISETKMISNAINSESRSFYSLEYQYNALAALLSGSSIDSAEYQKVVQKYGQIITKQRLSQMRGELQKLEFEEQKKSLQYQIKSKTFATSQIITFLEKRTNGEIQNVSYNYLSKKRNKQNIDSNSSNGALASIQRAYVDRKLELTGIKDQIRQQNKRQKKMAARTLWLIVSRLQRKAEKVETYTLFNRLLLPRQFRVRV